MVDEFAIIVIKRFVSESIDLKKILTDSVFNGVFFLILW